jgi:hydrogenase nickel incorporation protein HypA/HybF
MMKHPGSKLLALDIRIGELSCVHEHSLRFCLEAALGQTAWAKAEIRIAAEPIQARCARCDGSFTVVNYEFVCPGCGGVEVEVVGGKEVRLESLEIDA